VPTLLAFKHVIKKLKIEEENKEITK